MFHSLQRWLFCLSVVSLVPCAACQRGATPDATAQSAATSNVAVIDLDEVAKRLGRDVEMNDAVQSAASSLNQQLNTVRAQLQEQFDRKLQQSAGADAPHTVSPASAIESMPAQGSTKGGQQGTQQASSTKATSMNGASSDGVTSASALAANLPPNELQAIKRPFDVQFAQYQVQARDKLAVHRANVVERFKREVRPVAERVAARRGAAVVVTKNDSVVFAVTPAADITDDVVRELQDAQFARPKQDGAASRTGATSGATNGSTTDGNAPADRSSLTNSAVSKQ